MAIALASKANSEGWAYEENPQMAIPPLVVVYLVAMVLVAWLVSQATDAELPGDGVSVGENTCPSSALQYGLGVVA